MADNLGAQSPSLRRSLTFKQTRPIRFFSAGLGLLLLCSCVIHGNSLYAATGTLPADVKMDSDAGRGNWIFVSVRLEDGKELPFFLDTGASGTCFDKSLEHLLGKRLGTDTSWHFGAKGDAGMYEAPKLYLGGSLLQMTGPAVATIDLSAAVEKYVGHPIAGVLGMDVLEHYCIQLDFQANTIHFLDSDHADKRGWGRAYALTNVDDAYPVLRANLAGGDSPGSLIDTGCNGDGWLGAVLFQQWTNRAESAKPGLASSPDGLFDGEKYSEMELQRLEDDVGLSGDSHMKVNGIGLRFLARHLVTLDFPKRTLYLKRISTGPLLLTVKEQKREGKSVYRFVANLKKREQLPGWPRGDKLPKHATFQYHTLNSGTLKFQKEGDALVYHYWVTRPSQNRSWELKKAWQTDSGGQTKNEYPVP